MNVAKYVARAIAHGQKGAAGAGMLVSFLVTAILASVLIPVAITTISGTDTTGWGASEILIWGLLPLIIVVGLLFIFLRKAGLGSGSGD